MIFFDASRAANQLSIRKVLGDNSEDALEKFRTLFIQHISRGSEKHRGVGSAGDVETMFVKTRKPLSHIQKKSRTNYGSNTASLLYTQVKKPSWASLGQVTHAEKLAAFDRSCPNQNGQSLDPTRWADKAARTRIKSQRLRATSCHSTGGKGASISTWKSSRISTSYRS